MIVPFETAGGTGEHKSTQFSSELTRNMYLDMSETNGRRGCHDFPGLKLITEGSGVDRGHHVMANTLYLINATSLIAENSNGSRTTLGTVSGTDRAIFADDGSNLYFTVNNTLYKLSGATVSTVSQSVVTNPSSVAYINRQFIITGDNGLFATSDVADGDTYSALNFAEAEVKPDPLLRAYVFNQLVYMLGSKTTELWYNSGSGQPPFSRQDTALVNTGIVGKHAVTSSDQFLYFMSDDRKFYQVIGSSKRYISTNGIAHIVEGFSTVDDCIASAFVFRGQDFILFKFPTEGAALLYSEQNNYWVELSAGTDLTRASWYGNAVVKAYDKNIVIDYRNGNSYELDEDTYTDNGDTRLRIRVLPSFTAKDVGGVGRILAKHARINMQCGVGLDTGQGSDPELMCQFSAEGGEIWQAIQLVKFGKAGEYVKPVDFFDFANGYEIKIRIMVSDPVPVSMFDGAIDIRLAGY